MRRESARRAQGVPYGPGPMGWAGGRATYTWTTRACRAADLVRWGLFFWHLAPLCRTGSTPVVYGDGALMGVLPRRAYSAEVWLAEVHVYCEAPAMYVEVFLIGLIRLSIWFAGQAFHSVRVSSIGRLLLTCVVLCVGRFLVLPSFFWSVPPTPPTPPALVTKSHGRASVPCTPLSSSRC